MTRLEIIELAVKCYLESAQDLKAPFIVPSSLARFIEERLAEIDAEQFETYKEFERISEHAN